MELPTNIVSKLTGKSDLEDKIKELEKRIEVKDIERDAWVSAVEGLKIQLANALDEIKRLKSESQEEKITEQRSDNAGEAHGGNGSKK
ncbi:hypothetical protein DOTSEDRAFT_179759 [Dothistroma septosporum NZE10]|uniref:Uncharacterized protein n=1 Tax=Dothistroma septosporum (strain NZE10 / CBS 128990) TaxID=675120 RepID=M2Y1V7_DOTSN|nr:hypothetical protein DOTSEDRAFT_179759 [Dothistroma septosporum NZE10]